MISRMAITLIILATHFIYLYVFSNIALSHIMIYLSLLIMVFYVSNKLLSRKKRFYFKKEYKYIILITIVLIIYFIMFNFEYFTSNYIELPKLIFYLIMFWFIPYVFIEIAYQEKFNLKKFENIYFYCIMINVIFIFIQFIGFYIFNIYFELPYQTIYWDSVIRPVGFFGEPAHFGSFCLGIVMYDDKFFKHNIRNIILVVVALVISGSVVNIITSTIIILKLIKSLNLKKKFIMGVLILSGGIIIASFNLDLFTRLEYALQTDINEIDGSTLVRVYKGPIIFNNMDLEEKIIGLGIGNESRISEYINNSRLYRLFLGDMQDYFSGLGYEMVFFGIFGLLILNLFYYIYLGKNNTLFFIGFEILRLGTSISYPSPIIPMYIILYQILGIKRNENYNNQLNEKEGCINEKNY